MPLHTMSFLISPVMLPLPIFPGLLDTWHIVLRDLGEDNLKLTPKVKQLFICRMNSIPLVRFSCVCERERGRGDQCVQVCMYVGALVCTFKCRN